MSMPIQEFFEAYHALIDEILHRGTIEENLRTGTQVCMVPGGYSFKISLHDNLMPMPGNRRIYPYIAAAEIAWYLQAERDITWLRQYTKIWDKFVEDDNRTVKNAYGYRWRKGFGRDQILEAIIALTNDPSSRQVVVSAWDPALDGLVRQGEKNVPCPTHFTFNRINDQLHSSLFIRSSDVFVGLPYDVLGHALLMRAVAMSLKIKLGTLHVTLAHAHIYKPHWEMALESLKHCHPESPEMPRHKVYWIEKNPDEYIKRIREVSNGIQWPKYNPKPEVIA